MNVAVDIVDAVRNRLAREGSEPSVSAVADALRSEGRLVGDRTVVAIVDRLRREASGLGPLEALVNRPGVTDVLVNGPRQVFVDAGAGLEQVDVVFDDDEAVRRLAQRMAAVAGRRLDDASPYVDARLPDGARLHAVLAPIARPGTVLSLRVPPRRAYTLDELVDVGALETWVVPLLQRLLSARLAFLVTGGAGAGKTTLLAALLGLLPVDERLIVVEDSSELRPDHPHLVGLESRQANIEGVGSVPMRALVRQALRMRPDRIVVGEVRGAEVVDLLAALNTGHEGGCGTLHANSAVDVPARIEALGVAAGLSREAVHSQLGSAIDVVLHVDRSTEGRRRLREIATVVARDGLVTMRTVAAVDKSGDFTWTDRRDSLLELLTDRERA